MKCAYRHCESERAFGRKYCSDRHMKYEAQHKWRDRHPEKWAAQKRRSAEKFKERRPNYQKEWHAAHPHYDRDRSRAMAAKARAYDELMAKMGEKHGLDT